jgi:23S rRNA (pseudouridine1915-N3)-methyltransferase
MKLRVIWIGKTRNPDLTRLINDYISRIEHFLPLEIVELKEPKNDPDKRVDAEGKRLLEALGAMDRAVALDPAGKSWTSAELSRFVQKHMTEDQRRLTFVIGGFGGLSDAVTKRADVRWSLSPLTFTHDLTRLLLLEQIYRALSIIHNLPYSK